MFSDDDIKDFIDSDDPQNNTYNFSVDDVIIDEVLNRINGISKDVKEIREVVIKILNILDGSKDI